MGLTRCYKTVVFYINLYVGVRLQWLGVNTVVEIVSLFYTSIRAGLLHICTSDLGRSTKLSNHVAVICLQHFQFSQLGIDSVLEWYWAACSSFVEVDVYTWRSFHFLPRAGARLRSRTRCRTMYWSSQDAGTLSSWRRTRYIITLTVFNSAADRWTILGLMKQANKHGIKSMGKLCLIGDF